MNIFLNIFRQYLITIQRFVSRNFVLSSEVSNTVFVVFFLTTVFILAWLESFTDLNLINGRFSLMLFGIPVFIICLPLSFWYDRNSPTLSEIKEGKDQYTGTILFLISIVLFAFFRK
jgi:hypothetical protein